MVWQVLLTDVLTRVEGPLWSLARWHCHDRRGELLPYEFPQFRLHFLQFHIGNRHKNDWKTRKKRPFSPCNLSRNDGIPYAPLAGGRPGRPASADIPDIEGHSAALASTSPGAPVALVVAPGDSRASRQGRPAASALNSPHKEPKWISVFSQVPRQQSPFLPMRRPALPAQCPHRAHQHLRRM